MTDVIGTKVIEIVADHMCIPENSITEATRFREDMGADSLDLIELTMEFEDEFDVAISDEEADKIKTVGQAIGWIKEHINDF